MIVISVNTDPPLLLLSVANSMGKCYIIWKYLNLKDLLQLERLKYLVLFQIISASIANIFINVSII